MQIRKNDNGELNSGFQSEASKAIGRATSAGLENLVAEILNVEVEAGVKGLRVLRVGKESPLCCLEALGSFGMQGLVESGDRIVAINGVFAHQVTDLERLMINRRFCEITIFDHRTRLTVSWMMPVRDLRSIA